MKVHVSGCSALEPYDLHDSLVAVETVESQLALCHKSPTKYNLKHQKLKSLTHLCQCAMKGTFGQCMPRPDTMFGSIWSGLYYMCLHYIKISIKSDTRNKADTKKTGNGPKSEAKESIQWPSLTLWPYFFPKKNVLTFHVNYLPSRWFTWNVKTYLLWK